MMKIVEGLDRPYKGEWTEMMRGDGFMLSGGMGVGTTANGQDRRRFEIFDSAIYDETKSFDKALIGKTDLLMNGPDIVGLIDISLKPAMRRGGIGRKIISALVETSPDDFVIYDIQTKAMTFWRKLGATFYSRAGEPVVSPKNEKVVLGVIRKNGGDRPITALPGWFPAPR